MSINRMFDSAKTLSAMYLDHSGNGTYRTCAPLDLRQPPFVWLLVFVEQRLDLLLLLALTDLVGVSNLEELRCNFNQPLGFYCCYVVAIFASG